MKSKCPSCNYQNPQDANYCSKCLHSLLIVDLPNNPKSNENIQKALMQAPVSDLVTGEDLLVCSKTDPVEKIVQAFQREYKSCVIVAEGPKVVGIVSFRDLLFKVANKGRHLSEIKIGEIMTRNPECIGVDDPIAYAVNKMAVGGFRHIPVLSADNKPLGIINIKDVMRYLDLRD